MPKAIKPKAIMYVMVSVRFTPEQYRSLIEVCKHYRTNGKLSAGIRLAIEDVARQAKLLKMQEKTINNLWESTKGGNAGEHPSNEGASQSVDDRE